MPPYMFQMTLSEVFKAHLRMSFIIAQPALSQAIKTIFIHKFGLGEWLHHFQRHIGRSLKSHVLDDGTAFDICTLAQVLLGSISEVIVPILGLDRPERDSMLQELLLCTRTVYTSRNWLSHDFSATISECQFAIASLIKLCRLLQLLIPDSALDACFKSCIEELEKCVTTVERLPYSASATGLISLSMSVDMVASVLLLRSFQRLCVAAEDQNSPLCDPSSSRFDSSTGRMSYVDVSHVVGDMQSSGKMGKASTSDYVFVTKGRNFVFHGTERNDALVLLFSIGAVARLLRFLGPAAISASILVVNELLMLFEYLGLSNEASVLQCIASSQKVTLPSDVKDVSWLRHLLWTSAPLSFASVSPKSSKDTFTAQIHDILSTFELDKLAAYCISEFKHLKNSSGSSFELPAADTVVNKQQRCDVLVAALVLSSFETRLSMCSFERIEVSVSAESCLVAGKRSPEQRDAYFTGRSTELKRVCDIIESVLLNKRPLPLCAHLIIVGLSGMGKSSLVSQAILCMQATHEANLRDVYFFRLRGRGSACLQEDFLMHARSMGTRIGVDSDTDDQIVLQKFKDYLMHVRFVVSIDDANCEGLRSAAEIIPVSTEVHAFLVTSQQPAEELLMVMPGSCEVIELSKFDECTSLELLQKMFSRCSGLQMQADLLKDIVRRQHYLPIALRLFGEWSQTRYHRQAKTLMQSRKSFMEMCSFLLGTSFDEHIAYKQFCSGYMVHSGFCDDAGIALGILQDWLTNSDTADEQVLRASENHPRGLVGTVRLILLELETSYAHHATAYRQLLSVLAFCPPVGTPRSLFIGHERNSPEHLKESEVFWCREDLNLILELLQQSGLVQVHGELINLHSHYQLVLRKEIHGVEKAKVLVDKRLMENHFDAPVTVREFLPACYHVIQEAKLFEKSPNPWYYAAFHNIAVIIRDFGGGELEVAARKAILLEDENQDTEEYAAHLSLLSFALTRIGKFGKALDLEKQVLSLRQRLLPDKHEDVMEAQLNVVSSLMTLNRLEDADDILKSFEVCMSGVGISLPLTLITGYILNKSQFEEYHGRLDKALEFNEVLLRVYLAEATTLTGQEKEDYAKTIMHLGGIYFKLKRYTEALDRRKEALEMYKSCLPSNHHIIAKALRDTATSYLAMNRDSEALDLYNEALAVYKSTHSADHIAISQQIMLIANTYSSLNRHSEALEYSKQALAIHQRARPDGHPLFALSMMQSASNCDALGYYSEALLLRTQALSMYRQLFSADHPDIADALSQTARSHADLGQHLEALDLRKQSFAMHQRLYPVGHHKLGSSLASCMLEVGISYFDLSRHIEALDMFEQTLLLLKSTLPPDEFHISKVKMRMALCFFQLRRHADALNLFENVLAFRRGVLSADHLGLASVMANTAVLYSCLGRHAEAIDMLEEELALRRRVMPTDHPDFSICLGNISDHFGREFRSSGLGLCLSQAGWFGYEALHIARLCYTESHPRVQQVSKFLRSEKQIHGNAFQPMPSSSSEHLRIGFLVRLQGLSTHVLNGHDALVFGPERNGRVPVRLVEASNQVRSTLMWAKGVEKSIKVENLQAMGLPPISQQRL